MSEHEYLELNTKYEQRNIAKSLGARWSQHKNKWICTKIDRLCIDKFYIKKDMVNPYIPKKTTNMLYYHGELYD